MWFQFLIITGILTYGHAKDNHRRKEITHIDTDENVYDVNSGETKSHKTIGHAVVGEVIVEKFIETLIASEKYLKMIETIERKLTHLDAVFHEKSSTMTKYLNELLKGNKPSPNDGLEDSLRSMKSDLDKLKHSMVERIQDNPMLRVEGSEYHLEGSMETKFVSLESNMKSLLTRVDSILTIMSEVKNRQYARTSPKFDAGSGVPFDSVSLISEFRKTLREHKYKKCDCRTGRVDRTERYPSDCFEIQMQGFNVSGIYKVKPDEMESFYVLCDLATVGGGWTVIQNRFDGSQDFYKGWSDYANGFGNLAGEFWLGLEKVSYLTNQKLYELRIEIETQSGHEAYARYSVFSLGPEDEGYRISTLGTYFGTAGDSLSYHAGQKFSTFDTDNDEWREGSCAKEHGGAWWYKECDKSNLNGKYSANTEESRAQSIYWISFKGPDNPLVKTKMMIRPLPARRPTDFNELNRKHLDGSRIKTHHEKSPHIKDIKKKHEGDRNYPQRYNDHTHNDAFFPNYA